LKQFIWILGGSSLKFIALLRKGEQDQQSTCKRFLYCCGTFVTLVLILTVISQFGVGSSAPGRLDTIIAKDVEQIPLFLRLFSSALHTSEILLMLFSTSLLDFTLIAFSKFVKHGLRAIQLLSLDREYCPTDTASESFELHFNQFNKLEGLVNEFNELFATLTFTFKAFAMFNLYLFTFGILNVTHDSRIYDTTDGLLGIGLLSMVATFIVFRILYMLRSVGSVYGESQVFKDSWSKALGYLTDLQRHQLTMIRPFGIKSGKLYSIKPCTVLTFFSVLTTHIIVILQVYDL
jgi:hypothetical protein